MNEVRARPEDVRHIRRPVPPRARVPHVLASFLRWNVAHVRWRLFNLVDALRGRGTLEQKATRLVEAIEGIGGTGVKVGQTAAMRIDLMPLEFSLALSSMDGRRPPMAFAEAERRIEKAAGRPLRDVFAHFDRAPFSSSISFCIYRATLLDGRPVAVKVRREGVRSRLVADLVAVSWNLRVLEATSAWRPGLLQSLRQDLLELANDRLDLYFQARYQAVFRRLARKEGPRWVTAPRAYPQLSDHAVLVSDFVEGVPLTELVDAVTRGDGPALARFAAAGIDPRKVGRRLLQVAWWAAFENVFFVSGVSSSNILVRPGNELVFVDFEDSGMLTTAQKRHFQEVLAQLGHSDVSGAARSLVQVLSPLPFIDVFDFTKRIETGLWQELLAFRDREAEWWERTTIGVWRTAMRAARQDQIGVRLDILRFMASMLSYDTLAAQLIPDLDLLREFRRYRRAADTRTARRFRRDLRRYSAKEARSATVATIARAAEGVSRIAHWLETNVENLPITNLAVAGKAAYAVSQGVRLAGAVAVLTGVGMAIDAVSRATADPLGSLVATVLHPVWAVAVGVLVLLTVRRVLYRLDDKQD